MRKNRFTTGHWVKWYEWYELNGQTMAIRYASEGDPMTMIGTSSGCLRKFSLQKRKCTKLSRLACEIKHRTEFAFGYDPDLCGFLQTCDKRNDRFGQVKKIHNLSHA
ncbi:MAG: hypothetical protein L6437_01370, partial [Kiritimatiellae bacterium]|nr:hypothetical protein [Kiritimatiellia bacterium]